MVGRALLQKLLVINYMLMNTSYHRFSQIILIGLFALLCLNKQIFGEQPLSTRLTQELTILAKTKPELATELTKLAVEVPAARAALESHIAEGGTAAMLVTLWKWGDILVTTFNSVKNDFDAFKKQWPQVVKHGRLLCAIADENGNKHLFSTVLNEPGEQGVPLVPLQTYGLKGEDAAIFVEEGNESDFWSVQVVEGRELLVLGQRYAGNVKTMLQDVRVQKLQVTKDSGIEIISDKTESVRWDPPWLKDKEKSP